jgi:hypothetical protein
MKAWPFMFAASRTSDYQFVALPDIFDTVSCGSLRDSLAMDEADPKRMRTATLTVSDGRALSCVYRSGPIRLGDEIQVDSAGRKLLFASGLVLEGSPKTLDEPSSVIDANAQWFDGKLISFLNSSKNWTPVATKSFELQGDPPVQIPRRGRGPIIAIAVLLIVSLLLLALCVQLYLKNRSLEAQLRDSRPASAVDPSHELEKKGPLNIQREQR